MSCLRRLAVCAGIVSLLTISGCGLNPQPEPPSADETSDAPAEPDDAGHAPLPGNDLETPDADRPPTEPDSGYARRGDLDPKASSDYAASPDLTLPDAGAGPERDAGSPDGDAGGFELAPDSGVLTL